MVEQKRSPSEELDAIDAERAEREAAWAAERRECEAAWNERAKDALARLDAEANAAKATLARIEAIKERFVVLRPERAHVDAPSKRGRLQPQPRATERAIGNRSTVERRRSTMMNRPLIVELLVERDGPTFAELFDWIRRYKPNVSRQTIQGEIWRAQKKGLVRTSGKHGAMRYHATRSQRSEVAAAE